MPTAPFDASEHAGPDPARDPASAPTVLIVEDDPSVRTMARRVLEHEGFRVLEAEDGMAGLDAAATSTHIDLVLTDLTMPRLGGEAMAARLAAVRPDLPVVFMSGYSDSAIFDDRAGAAAPTLLVKPFTIDELVATIRRSLTPGG